MCKFFVKKGVYCKRPEVIQGYCTQHYNVISGIAKAQGQPKAQGQSKAPIHPKAQPKAQAQSKAQIQPKAIPDVPAPALPNHRDDFFDQYTIDKILTTDEKDSSSNTLIVFAHHNTSGLPVAVKVFVDYKTKDDGLKFEYAKFLYESRMYQEISQQSGLTNIVRWIGLQHYTAEEFTEKASLKLRKGLRSILVKGKKIKMVTLLINERRPAAGILNLELLSKADKKNILYQIIFTLAQLENLGYQHNDLRLGNILIDHVPDEKTIHYAGRVLPIRKKALLFDWDLGLCQSCGANPILDVDFCPNYGMCNILNPRFDIYTLLRAYDIPGDAQLLLFKKFAGIPDRIVKVYDYNGQDGAYQKITPVIPPDSITQAWVDRMCNYDTLNKKCIPFPLGEPKTIRRPTELINHPYFRDLFLA